MDGIDFSATVQDPSGFTGGQWDYIQTVSLSSTRLVNGITQSLADWVNGVPYTTGLDTAYPYEPSDSTWPANATSQNCSDNPLDSLELVASSYSENWSFDTYVMYMPPGTQSVFVPVYYWAWCWSAQATQANGALQ